MNEKDSEYRVVALEYLLRNQCYEIDPKKITDTSFYSYRHINRLFTLKNGVLTPNGQNGLGLQ